MEAESTTQSKRNPLMYIFVICFLVDVILACGLSFELYRNVAPLWLALTLGIPTGIVVIVAFYAVTMRGTGEVLDFVIQHFIVFILAVVLFPVFSSARAKAHNATCVSNLKATGVAVLLYAQDWDDTFPSAERWGDSALTKMNSHGAPTLLHCPDSSSAYSYAFNSGLNQFSFLERMHPEEVVMLFEADAMSRNAAGSQAMVVPVPRHSGVNNYEFADGHAKSIAADAVSSLIWQADTVTRP